MAITASAWPWARGDLFVAEHGYDIVPVFRPDGALVRVWGSPGPGIGPGQCKIPYGL